MFDPMDWYDRQQELAWQWRKRNKRVCDELPPEQRGIWGTYVFAPLDLVEQQQERDRAAAWFRSVLDGERRVSDGE